MQNALNLHSIENLLLENSSDAIAITDKNENIIEWNKAAVLLTGYSKNNVEGKSVISVLYHFYNPEKLKQEIIDELVVNGKFQRELKTKRIDGEIIVLNTLILPITDETGEPEGCLIIFKDNSYRKRLLKSKEAFLQVNKALLEEKNIFDSGNIVVFFLRNSKDFPIEYISENVEYVLGFKQEELMNNNTEFLSLIHSDDKNAYVKKINSSVSQEQTSFDHTQYRVTHKNKSTIWLYDHYQAKIDGNGNITHFTGYFFNITDKIKNEQEKEFVRSLIIDNTFEAVFITQLDSKIVEWNKAAEIMFGKKRSEVLGKSPYDIIYTKQEDALKVRKKIIKQINKKGFWAGTLPYNKNGKETGIRQIRVLPIYNNEKIITHLVSFSKDVTHEIEVQTQLEKNKEKWELIFNKSNDMLFVNRYEGNFFEVNNVACEKLGYTREELYNLRPTDVINMDKYEYEKMIEEIPLKQFSLNEIEFKTKNRDVIPVECKFHAFVLDGYLTILAVARDITLRKQMEKERENFIKQLEDKNNKLERLSKMKDDFLAVASHDLRTPFSGILNFTELLLEEEEIKQNPEHKYYLEMILESAETQLQYVNSLLNAILLESGKIKLDLVMVSPEKLITTCVQNLKILAKKKQILLYCEYSKSECNEKILLDPPKIKQVINNLVANAIKFTQFQGIVRVICDLIKSNSGKKFLEVHVIDSGIGIPQDKIQKLFNRFEQAHEYGTMGEKGTGLGLSICKNLVELHGGSINVKSVPDKGSDFYFTLPLSN